VGTSASPVGGDDVSLDVEIAPGSASTIMSSAATIALPGLHGDESRWTVHARVGTKARLHWRPEPTVAAARCRHRASAYVEIAPDAIVTWREELVLGRAGEEPGWCTTRLHVDRDGLPLVRHDLVIDAHACSIGVLGNARAIGTLLVAGAPVPRCTDRAPRDDYEAEVFRLDDDVALVMVLSRSVAMMRAVLHDYLDECRALGLDRE
jgi:urease accessory protein